MRILLTVIVLFVAACTVTPDRVGAGHASYDGGVANSGILNLDKYGAVVTPHLRDRYNALVDLYGKRFTPALKRNVGFFPTPEGNFRIDNQTLEQLLIMAEWKRAGTLPK